MAETTAGAVRVLTVTISDLRKRAVDDLGKKLDAELTAAGFLVVRHVTVADEPEHIRALVSTTATTNGADAIILSGGTGITPRDQTFEALDGIYDKRIRGFGETLRRLSFELLGPRAMYFRASAGVVDQVPVFSLPGNAQAMLIGLRQLVIPTLVAAVDMATGRETHTARPAIPRERASTLDLSSTGERAAFSSTRDVNAAAKAESGGGGPTSAR